MSAELQQTADRHRWDFRDHQVTQLAIERTAIRITSWTMHASLEVRIAAAFRFREADGVERDVDPSKPEQLAPLLTLVGRRLESLVAMSAGDLELHFGDGSSLHVSPTARRDAWSAAGGGALEGMTYAC